MSESKPVLPRIAISFCTQCRWMLRAAYFGQELLSTFGNAIGEVALIPATGGLFKVELTYQPDGQSESGDHGATHSVVLWDRKAEGGFPETKVLKQRVRDHIEPSKDLGHSDKHGKGSVTDTSVPKPAETSVSQGESTRQESGKKTKRNPDGTVCEDCK